ncbi:MAG: hypothetical protein IKO72_04630 [Kiritimatiellae bacterium]|nr:hypothetical protein [Kiritimatiellia bacterium]
MKDIIGKMACGSAGRLVSACAVLVSALSARAVEIDLCAARITVENRENGTQARAAEELEKHLALIAGERKPAAGGFEFVIGRVAPGKVAAKDWESHAAAVDGKIYFWGDDGDGRRARPGSSFAVYGFLEKVLGVKWVRPGDDGIVFERRTKVEVPDGWTYRFYPPLEKSDIRVGACPKKRPDFSDFMFRKRFDLEVIPNEFMDAFTLSRMRPEYWDFRHWTWRMRLQTRATYRYGHAFVRWNDRFYKSHPEYMAMWHGTSRGHSRKENGKYVHLCYSNPGTQDQVIRDWLAAGTNEYLNICAAADDMKEYYARVRARGEAARIAIMKKGGLESALDDSELSRLMTFSGSNQAALDGDLAVIARAVARPGLSEAERRRVNEVRLVVEHAKLTQDFILKAPPEGVTDEFIAAAERLKAFRIRHVKDMREAWTMLFSDKKLERPLWHRVRGAHRSGKLQPSASL